MIEILSVTVLPFLIGSGLYCFAWQAGRKSIMRDILEVDDSCQLEDGEIFRNCKILVARGSELERVAEDWKRKNYSSDRS